MPKYASEIHAKKVISGKKSDTKRLSFLPSLPVA